MPPRLDDANSPNGQHGTTAICQGLEGVGKSTLFAYWETPFFLYDTFEHGIIRLIRKRLVPVQMDQTQQFNSWQELLLALDHCRNLPNRTIIVESLTGAERFAADEYCHDYYGGDTAKYFAYRDGPKAMAQALLPQLFRVCDYLTNAGKRVILTAHTEVKNFNNPLGPNYDRYKINMEEVCYQKIRAWVSNIWFLNYVVDVVAPLSKPGKLPPKGKVIQPDSLRRTLYTTWNPAYDAKSQGMPGQFVADDPAVLYQNIEPYL